MMRSYLEGRESALTRPPRDGWTAIAGLVSHICHGGWPMLCVSDAFIHHTDSLGGMFSSTGSVTSFFFDVI